MMRLTLNEEEAGAVRSLIAEIASRHRNVEDPELLRDLALYAHELPRRLRAALIHFRLTEPAGGVLIVGEYPVVEDKIGRTPSHWRERGEVSPTLEEEIFLMLTGSLLGDLIGWATQQDGYIVHDIVPIASFKDTQMGTGSEQLLWWHTEDAFHPYRGDYLGLLCLRNPEVVATTFGSLEQVDLDPNLVDILFQPRFTIRPDESHLKTATTRSPDGDQALCSSYDHIEQMNTQPEKVAVLFGDRRSPYVRLDPYFMDPPPGDPEAQRALKALVQQIEATLSETVLRPGEICFIDNFKAVHGRKPFHARYDGRDRWLKRINITRDLRKSRDARRSSEARILF